MTLIIDHVSSETRSVKQLTDGLTEGTIIIDDSFQRNFVWGVKDQVSLIETILMGFPIPEIYLWYTETNSDTGDTILSVVDGQQRTNSVLRYIKNEFKLDKRYLEDPTSSYSGKLFKELDASQKKIIWKYPFSVRFIKDNISKEEIINIFLRLNRTNISLNPQELRKAEFSGEFIKLAATIADLPFWETYSIFKPGDVRRMIDVQFVSTLLIFLRKGIAEETNQSILNKVYDQYNEDYPEAKSDFQQFKKILILLGKLAKGKAHLHNAYASKTQLYTMFSLGYYLLTVKANEISEISDNLEEWYKNYDNNTEFKLKKKQSLLNEYHALSREGVQKKANRQRRFEIIKSYLEI